MSDPYIRLRRGDGLDGAKAHTRKTTIKSTISVCSFRIIIRARNEYGNLLFVTDRLKFFENLSSGFGK